MVHELPEIGIEHVSDAVIAQVVNIKVNKKSIYLPQYPIKFPSPPRDRILEEYLPVNNLLFHKTNTYYPFTW